MRARPRLRRVVVLAALLILATVPAAWSAAPPPSAAEGVDARLARAEELRRGGRHGDALDELTAALALARQERHSGLLAAILNDIGNRLASAGEATAARARFEESLRLARKARRFDTAGAAAINAARLSVQAGDEAAGRDWLAAAQDALARQDASAGKALQLLALGRALAGLGDTGPAFAAYREADDIARGAGDLRLESYAKGYLARLYIAAGRREEALALTRQALFQAHRAGAPEVLYLWQWQLGRLLAGNGEVDAAIGAYQSAADTLAVVRPDLLLADAPGAGSPLRETVEPVYLELADLLLRRAAAAPERAATQADLDAARRLVERFRAVELEEYFQDECVAELQSRVRPIDRLDAGTAAIYPILLPERTVLLLSLPDRLAQVSLPIDREALTADVRELRLLLEKRTTRQYLPPAQRLYDRLIRPVEAHLERAGIDTLVFIPAGPLRTIPLAALHDGERFLIERFAIATVPGLELLDPRPLAERDLTLLLNGLTRSVQGFPALPYVERELEAIQQLHGGTRLQDEAFVVPELQESLARTPFSVVHIASHGTFAGNPEDSFLLTWDGRLDMDGLERFIKLSRFRDDPVELLTLSACQTAAGDDRAALGLAGIAVKAGARSALATLWFINDQASSLLVAEFYRQLGLRPTPTKAKALQRAQEAIKADSRYRHPAYWAPFLIIGNWL